MAISLPIPSTKTLDTVAVPWRADETYQAYVTAQVAKTQRMRGYLAAHRIQNLVRSLVHADRRSPIGRSVLCIGCRNTFEIGTLHAAGFGPVMGIDLVRMHPTIQAMDMHAMSFPDAMFDVVFSCHSLEHAYDINAALREWRRVTVPGGTWAIEVPIRFSPTEVDRQDVGSLTGLRQECAPFLERPLWGEESSDGTVARLIGQTYG